MGRKRKVINTTGLPDYKLEAFARAIWPAILADFKNPEVQQEFQEWKKRREAESIKPKMKTA